MQVNDIDFVIAWVDGSDSKWQEKKTSYVNVCKEQDRNIYYRDWGLLPYLFRSIEMYASWVHKVYLVTDGQIPKWVNMGHPKLVIVDHKDFIPEKYLPTFNSHTIELNLHRIKGLSEQFVYFNDDFFLTAPVEPTDFFQNGKPVDEGTLNGINGKDEEFASIQFQNMSLMNRHYDVKACRRNLWKWLNPAYGRNMMRTLLLLPFQRLQGIYNPHGPMPLLKETCERVWERDGEILNQTCQCKVRGRDNVSCYIYRYEQLLSGGFVPHKAMNRYHCVTDPIRKIRKDMECAKSICLNDVYMEEKEFAKRRTELQNLMKRKFTQKSRYEK